MKKVMRLLILLVLLLAFAPASAFAADGIEDISGMESVFAMLVALSMIAVILERIVETVKNKIAPAKPPEWLWFTIISAIGVAICIPARLDLLGAINVIGGPVVFIIGCIISGLFIGAGSGVIHSIKDKLTGAKGAATHPDTADEYIEKYVPAHLAEPISEKLRKTMLDAEWRNGEEDGGNNE